MAASAARPADPRRGGIPYGMLWALPVIACVSVSACWGGGGVGGLDIRIPDDNPYQGYRSELYDGPENWLCRPDLAGDRNACDADISATLVFADGSQQAEEDAPRGVQPVNCFYLYPTVSNDPGDNSDLVPAAEISATTLQAARYRSVCNVHAPVYRQITLSALFNGKYFDSGINDVAYADVVDAFRRFIANGNGRGFILVGHSQGSTHLIRLIQEEVERDLYLTKRFVSAHLIGMTVALPNNADVGVTFKQTPPCTFDEEIGCFVNYSSFREGEPPDQVTDTGIAFGFTESDATRAACTHPVDLGGGRLALDAYFQTDQAGGYQDPDLNDTIPTDLVKLPGLVEGECIEEDGAAYLSIRVNGDPGDPRVDDIPGDFLPGWGLHLVDVALAQGDLVRLAGRQAEQWLNEQD